jgi:hypothetical protein
MSDQNKVTKRTFLQTVGAGVPSLKLLLDNTPAAAASTPAGPAVTAASKFTPINCSRYLTASPIAFGPREQAKGLVAEAARDGLIRTPGGRQSFRGIPFVLGPEEVRKKAWVVLSLRKSSWSKRAVEIPIRQKASFVCLAQFCDWDEKETPKPGSDAPERVGQHLADVALVYEGGTQHVHSIRRRFEVNSLSVHWGQLCFTAVPHRQDVPSKLTDPLPAATLWGDLQLGVWDTNYANNPDLDWRGTLWLCSLENPSPDRTVKSVRLEAKADDPLAICGITIYHGREDPLRYERLSLYRLTLPKEEGQWEVGVDLGTVARTYQLPPFEGKRWLSSTGVGLGEPTVPVEGSRYLYAEVSASPDATLTLSTLIHRYDDVLY